MGTRVLSRQYGGRGLKLTIHLRLVTRLRISEHICTPHTCLHGVNRETLPLSLPLPENLNIQKPQTSDGDAVQEGTTCRKHGHAFSLESTLKEL
jgi:hypothetical protein